MNASKKILDRESAIAQILTRFSSHRRRYREAGQGWVAFEEVMLVVRQVFVLSLPAGLLLQRL